MNVVVTPAMLGQVVVSGLLAGALYAMVALGLALIFGVMRVINVAHGPLLMLGAYTTYFLWAQAGLNPYLSIPVSMAVLFVLGPSFSARWCSASSTRPSSPRSCSRSGSPSPS